jgi:hypothetical protein
MFFGGRTERTAVGLLFACVSAMVIGTDSQPVVFQGLFGVGSGHRVVTAFAKRVAAANSLDCKPGTAKGAVPADGF